MASTRLGEILTATRNITITLSAQSNSDGGVPLDVENGRARLLVRV